MASGRETGGRGRGRPPRDPELKPAHVDYATWRAAWLPWMERLLPLLEAEHAQWREHERKRAAAQRAREAGLDVADPPPPRTIFAGYAQLARLPEAKRAEIVAVAGRVRAPMPEPVLLRDHRGLVRPLPLTVTRGAVACWLQAEAVKRGVVCDFESPYQVWHCYAQLLLRDDDVGLVAGKVAPHRIEARSPRNDERDTRTLNADMTRQERKRIARRKRAFGYD